MNVTNCNDYTKNTKVFSKNADKKYVGKKNELVIKYSCFLGKRKISIGKQE